MTKDIIPRDSFAAAKARAAAERAPTGFADAYAAGLRANQNPDIIENVSGETIGNPDLIASVPKALGRAASFGGEISLPDVITGVPSFNPDRQNEQIAQTPIIDSVPGITRPSIE